MCAMRNALRGAIAVLVVAILGAALAQATVFDGVHVRATFNGWLTPHTLPRSKPVPVSLHMKGSVTTPTGDQPPQLRRMTISINRNGILSTAGLPLCPKRRLTSTTTAQALAACRGSVVGSGRFTAHIAIPSQAPFPARGRLVAFNSVRHGRPVILAHIYGTVPVPTSQLLEMFVARTRRGTFGTILSVKMPTFVAGWGYVNGFRLNLHRLYRYAGGQRSLLTASCPAPTGFKAASFAAAKGTYYLSDGRKLTRVLDGSCRVSD
jgi:hypothetical protein